MATMISHLLEPVTGLKRFIPTLIKKTVITVTFEIQLLFVKKKTTQFLFCYANKIRKILLESSNDSAVYLNFKTH